ncbi:MAG TPA: GNAT family N-acetyltransferase [Verrucomicrobiae bacterium]|nr:GNAT family N-acetyltransferase [Verrucomicrobiae bacterium]
MKIETLPGLEAVDPARWDALVAQSTTGSVFLTIAWQAAWLAAFGHGRPLRVLAARDETDALAGLLPLYEDEPGLWRIVGGVDVSDYLDLIAASGREEEVWEALLQHRAAERTVWHLRGLRAESPTATRLPGLAPAHGLTCVVEREERCPLLRLPESWDAYLAMLSGKDRHELRRKMRKLEGELPAVSVRSVTTPAEMRAGLDDFLRLHRASRTGKAKFMDERMEGFFRVVLDALAVAGWVRLWFLESAGTPVASFICTEYGGAVGLYNSGFDPAHSRLAPGIVLLGHVIRDAIERRVPLFDFLRGEEPYKYAFGPTPTDVMSARLEP